MIKYLILIAMGCALAYWYNFDVYVQPGRAEVASERIKQAMYNMGNRRDFRILPNGQLQVQVKGKWLNLKY